MTSPFAGVYLFFCGLCMGIADLIPGISGGTIAFIMGIYFPLLASLNSFHLHSFRKLFSGQWTQCFENVQWKFLLPLLGGIICSVILFAQLIHHVLMHEVYRVYLYSTFLGLILASFCFCVRQIRQWKGRHVLGLCGGIIVAFFLTGSFLSYSSESYAIKRAANEKEVNLINYDSKNGLLGYLSANTLRGMLAKGLIDPDTELYENEGQLLGKVSDFVPSTTFPFLNGWLIFCGSVAICALLLPGISGSYLLSLLGVYPLIIGALADWISQMKEGIFDWDSFQVLSNVGIGIVLGLIIFSRLLNWLLKTFPGLSLAVLSGFMIGALRSVWPFWIYGYVLEPLKPEKGPLLQTIHPIFPNDINELGINFLFALAGFGLVFLLESQAGGAHFNKKDCCFMHKTHDSKRAHELGQ